MNDVKLAGRIGNELVLRYTTNSKAVIDVRLAVDRPGSDEPDWVNVTLWGRPAEVLAQHCATGDQIIITDAHLHPDVLDVDGKKYSTLTVQANRFEFAASAARNRETPTR